MGILSGLELGKSNSNQALRNHVRILLDYTGILVLIVLVFATIACSALNREAKNEPGPHVILIVIDALRADRVSYSGYQRDTSPRVDELSKKSFIFTNAITQYPATVISFKSLFTSKYLFEHKNDISKLPKLTEVLKANGYTTVGFTGGGYTNKAYGFAKGFDYYYDEGNLEGLEVINPKISDWLGKNKFDKLFLFIHTYDVHCPYYPPEPYLKMYTNKSYIPRFTTQGKCGNPFYNAQNLSPEDYYYISAVYDGGVRYTDMKLAEIFKILKDIGIYENAIIIFTADHGESLGEHEYIGHGLLWESQLKVPLLIKVPDAFLSPDTAPRVIDDPVQLIDLFPTIISMLNINIPNLTGEDLTQVMTGRKGLNDRIRLSEKLAGDGYKAIRQNEWKLIKRDENIQLYNLEQDPDEKQDLADSEPEIVEYLMDMLTTMEDNPKLSEDDPLISNNTLEELKSLGYIS